MRATVAIVDDDRMFTTLLGAHLGQDGLEIHRFHALREVYASPRLDGFDLFIVDVNLPDGSGMELLRELARRELPPQTIVVTGEPSFESAVDALRLGIVDFFSKPVELEQIRLAVLRTVQARRLHRQLASRAQLREAPDAFLDSLGGGRDLRELIVRASGSELPVFITGETGTGKSMLARWLHDAGPRAQGPFVGTNCAALPATLVEAELFGVERGAYTGAERARPGLFELADDGTLFLDEVAEMPRELQSKLLHALDSQSIRRVGGREERVVDVRVIAATNVNPAEAVSNGQLRQDLLFRLGVVPLVLPPLRRRAQQLPALVGRILASLDPRLRVTDLADGELARLQAHRWPGNVRELRNVLERALMMREGPLRPSRSMVEQPGFPAPEDPAGPPPTQSLEAVERAHILRVLDYTGGNRAQAARILDVAESTLRRKLKQYGLAPKSGTNPSATIGAARG